MSWRKRKESEPVAEAPKPLQPEASAPTYIDAGCELVGQLKFKDSVRIDGHVEGDIAGTKTVTVGQDAIIRARVQADRVVVHGTVEGDIVAKSEITLHKTATVSGELHTAGIVVERGARLKGCIVIGADPDGATQPGFGALASVPEFPETEEL
jgi:cytoskeletal protein CcmA (bactofilin family)